MKLHIELTDEQALNGFASDSVVRARVAKSDTLRRSLIRDALNRLVIANTGDAQ